MDQESVYKDIALADSGDAEAQVRVGNYYYYGQNVEPDTQKARHYYTASAEQGNPNGQYAIAYCYKYSDTPDYQKALYWFTKAAEQGLAHAQYELGCCYCYGEGTPIDYTKSFAWLEKSSTQEYAPAEYLLSLFYYDPTNYGDVVAVEYSLAANWALKSATQGYVLAQLLTGYFYENGIGVQQDYNTAVSWYQKAADAGHDGAILNLGLCYAFGRGVEKNVGKAIELYEESAKLGNSSAVFNLAELYHFGSGVQKDFNKALQYYSQAAEMGHTKSMVSLGSLYYSGEGVEQNFAKAFNYFFNAAQDNSVDAWVMLGKSYLLGRGVEPNYKEAVKWFQYAADQDDSEAFYYLGRCYSEGKGVPQNDRLANEYYTKASDGGFEAASEVINNSSSKSQTSEIDTLQDIFNKGNNAEAGLALGNIYMSSELASKNGVKTDFNKACEYFEASAKLGNTTAMERFAELTLLMGKETLKTNTEYVDYIIQDINNALRWADVRASKGLPMNQRFYNDAFLTLGCAYSWLVMFKKDVEMNSNMCIDCFRKVIDFGDDYFAMFRYIYVANRLRVDFDAQFKYAKIIADQGRGIFDDYYYPLVLNTLSVLYLNGLGCEVDVDEAYRYALLSSQLGFECSDYLSKFVRKFNGHYKFVG